MFMLSMLPGLLLAAAVALPAGDSALALSHPTPSAPSMKETATETIATETVAAPYPPAVRDALVKVRKSGGHTIVRTNGKSYVVIGAGQRPTGGYRIVADPLKKTGPHSYTLKVRVQGPAAGAMKTQAISYPTLVIAVPDQQAKVHVQMR
jgi:PrcB C-terminal